MKMTEFLDKIDKKNYDFEQEKLWAPRIVGEGCRHLTIGKYVKHNEDQICKMNEDRLIFQNEMKAKMNSL